MVAQKTATFAIVFAIAVVWEPVVFSTDTSQKGEQAAVAIINGESKPAPPVLSRKENQKPLRIFEVIAFGFFCGLSAGYLFGKARSPKFDDPTESPLAIRQYVVDKCRFEPLATPGTIETVESEADCVVGRNPDGTIASIGPVVTYYFSCGVVTYAYNAKTKQIQKRAFHRKTDTDYSRPPRHGFKFNETFALMVGGAGGYSLKETGSRLLDSVDTAKESNESLKMIFYTCLGAVSGVLLGFWLGYTKDPKCGEPLFQQLLNDTVFWEGVAEEHPETKWWWFFRTPEGVHVSTGTISLPLASVSNHLLSPVLEPEPLWVTSSATSVQQSVVAGAKLVLEDVEPEFKRLIASMRRYLRSSSGVFEKPSPTLVGVLKVLGEGALVTKLESQVGKNNGVRKGPKTVVQIT